MVEACLPVQPFSNRCSRPAAISPSCSRAHSSSTGNAGREAAPLRSGAVHPPRNVAIHLGTPGPLGRTLRATPHGDASGTKRRKDRASRKMCSRNGRLKPAIFCSRIRRALSTYPLCAVEHGECFGSMRIVTWKASTTTGFASTILRPSRMAGHFLLRGARMAAWQDELKATHPLLVDPPKCA
jgi:hypothetical protein